MLKTLALAATLISSTAASALPFQTRESFVHEQSGYVVRVRDNGSKMYLKGRNPATGQTFNLAVTRSGKVSGTYEGQPVNYVMGTTNTQQLATAHKALNAAQ